MTRPHIHAWLALSALAALVIGIALIPRSGRLQAQTAHRHVHQSPVQNVPLNSTPVRYNTIRNHAHSVSPADWGSPHSSEDAELERKTRRSVEALKKAESSEKRLAMRDELEQLVDQHFDVRMKNREEQINQIEKKLRRLKDEIEKRRRRRDEIVQLRLQTLINEANGLGF